MNVRLLEEVRQHIVAHPHRFSAAHWAWARNAHAVVRQGAAPEAFKCCIAGHALLLSGRYDESSLLAQTGGIFDNGTLSRRAADVLHLSEQERRVLFFPSQWPDAYKRAYYRSDRITEVEVCAAFLDYFIGMAIQPPPERAADRPPMVHHGASHASDQPMDASSSLQQRLRALGERLWEAARHPMMHVRVLAGAST